MSFAFTYFFQYFYLGLCAASSHFFATDRRAEYATAGREFRGSDRPLYCPPPPLVDRADTTYLIDGGRFTSGEDSTWDDDLK